MAATAPYWRQAVNGPPMTSEGDVRRVPRHPVYSCCCNLEEVVFLREQTLPALRAVLRCSHSRHLCGKVDAPKRKGPLEVKTPRLAASDVEHFFTCMMECSWKWGFIEYNSCPLSLGLSRGPPHANRILSTSIRDFGAAGLDTWTLATLFKTGSSGEEEWTICRCCVFFRLLRAPRSARVANEEINVIMQKGSCPSFDFSFLGKCSTSCYQNIARQWPNVRGDAVVEAGGR